MGITSRRQVHVENDRLRLTLLPGGGHIAAVVLKENGVNPLWDPPWKTVDPSAYDPEAHPGFGSGPDARLLAGIAGHSLCFDIFGVPSEQESVAGLGVHGEASSVDWDVESGDGWLEARAELPLARMQFSRRLELDDGRGAVSLTETATNLSAIDRAVGWTQHVTLGPPFLEKGQTLFEASATRSKVIEGEFAPGGGKYVAGAEFRWPKAPLAGGGTGDLRRIAGSGVSGAYTAHLMNPDCADAFFAAYHPGSETLFCYVWRSDGFPWLGIWEEDCSRTHAPWNGRTLARGMEFGVSPFPETRKAALGRGPLFDQPTIGWIPAGSTAIARYRMFLVRVPAADLRRFGFGMSLSALRPHLDGSA